MERQPDPAGITEPGLDALKAFKAEVGYEFPKVSKHTGFSLGSLHRWRLAGKLQAHRVGGRWYCTPAAIKAMIEESTAKATPTPRPVTGRRTEAQRKAAADAALAQCRELGI